VGRCLPLNQCLSAGPTGKNVGLAPIQSRQYALDGYPQTCMFRGRGFSCPASPPPLPRAFNSTFPPGVTTHVPQLRRFCVDTKSTQRKRALLCLDALLRYVSLLCFLLRYCFCFLLRSYFAAVLTRSLEHSIARGFRPLPSVPPHTRRSPRPQPTTRLLRTRRRHRGSRRSPPRGGSVRVHVRIPSLHRCSLCPLVACA
jgi:hypothetical protein